ncbi:MAG: hypothetical protein BJ554DRAFT_8117 [Olpidium bornovanus]|uniref:Uncharacterized protein n=1 Tax=Olpidium bornovanus TaxID=278681 RepID=A0A8H7ZVG9_9FUNG|nr:MAG: hypothetical protein BJ554DRAFT_8117 [Olpidium bornovanus]
MAGATRNKASLPREAGSLHEQIEKIRNAAEKTASDNKRAGGQSRADVNPLDPNALDILERLERAARMAAVARRTTPDPATYNNSWFGVC